MPDSYFSYGFVKLASLIFLKPVCVYDKGSTNE